VEAAIYSALQLDRATTCYLTDCQLTRHLPRKKEDPTGALAGVDVAGVVAVTVPDEVCHSGAPRVVEAVVEIPRNIADDSLHSLLVLHHRSLHEPTNVADGECQVRPCVSEVVKAPHKTPVLGSVCRCFTGCPPRGIPKVVSLGEETPRSGIRRCKEHKT
jgi:hypothetical protein